MYLFTTAISVTICFTRAVDLRKNLLDKGYVFSKKPDIKDYFLNMGMLLFPVINIGLAANALIKTDKDYEKELLEKKEIIDKTQEKATFFQVKQSIVEREQLQTLNTESTYEEISIEKRIKLLQEQRETLLNELSTTDQEIKNLRNQR